MKPCAHMQQSMIPQELLEIHVLQMVFVCMKNIRFTGNVANNTGMLQGNSGAYKDT